MALRNLLKKNLTPELFNQVVDELGDDFDYDYVPRKRLNKVIDQRNTLRQKVEGSEQGADDDDDGDTPPAPTGKGSEGMSKEDYEAKLAEMQEQFDNNMNSFKLQSAALDKLRTANALDPELVLKSGVIDMEKVKFKKDGTLTGFDEQLESAIESKGFLFGESDNYEAGTGRSGGTGDDGKTNAQDDKLNQIFEHFGALPTE